MIHREIIIRGKVQGVYYRGSAREMAEQLNIKGEVMNRADGSVFLIAEGEEEAVQRLIEWCHTGPSPAQVSSVEVKEGPLVHYTNFKVIQGIV